MKAIIAVLERGLVKQREREKERMMDECVGNEYGAVVVHLAKCDMLAQWGITHLLWLYTHTHSLSARWMVDRDG